MKHALALIPAIAADAVVDGAVRAVGGLALAWRRSSAWWRAQVVRGTATTACLVLGLAVVSFLAVDRPIAEAVREIDPDLRTWLETLTQLGDSAGYIIAGAVLTLALGIVELTWPALGARWRLVPWLRRTAYFTAAVVVSGLAAILLKFIVGRPRPRMWLGEENLYGLRPLTFDTSSDFASIPSGHTTTAVAVAVALVMIFGRRAIWFAIPLTLVVAATRVLLTAHFVADTLVGAVLGGVTAMALAPLFGIGGKPSVGGQSDRCSGLAETGKSIETVKVEARRGAGID